MSSVDSLILKSLIEREAYTRKVLPHIKPEYFSTRYGSAVFGIIKDYVLKYNDLPSPEAIVIAIENSGMDEGMYSGCFETLEDIDVYNTENATYEWLVDETEKWCQDRSLHLAINKSINIYEGGEKELTRASIPELVREALSVCFDANIGHDFMEDYEARYDMYTSTENRLSTGIEILDYVLGGGFSKKALYGFLGGTGAGKSMVKSALASNIVAAGNDVLVITCELSEEKYSERIDANLMDIPIGDLKKMSKESFSNNVHALKKRTPGRLIVKEYPTSSAHAGHFRHLLSELKLKKNFVPKIIFIDYINICVSSRIKGGENSYLYIKSIAEELRGLAVEFDVPIVTSTQTNRDGLNSTDPDLTNVSESTGLSSTLDFLCAIVRTEEFDKMNQIMFKVLKNRFNDINMCRKFLVGVDRSKMQLYDLESSAQQGLLGYTEPEESKYAPQRTVAGNNNLDKYKTLNV